MSASNLKFTHSTWNRKSVGLQLQQLFLLLVNQLTDYCLVYKDVECFKLLVLSDKPTIFQLLSVITKKSSESTNWFKHNLATVLEN